MVAPHNMSRGAKVAPASRESVEHTSVLNGLRLHHATHAVGPSDVQNKATIDVEISRFLGLGDALPAFEYVFVEEVKPEFSFLPQWLLGGWGLSFGHSALCYTRADGVRRLVNVTQGTGDVGEGELVEFWERPSDYTFGVRGAKSKGGIFSRSICVVRVPHWDAHALNSIDLYLRAISESFSSSQHGAHWTKHGSYRLCGLPATLRSWLCPGPRHAAGSCADWLSLAMWYAGLLRRPTAFPKAILAELIETLILAQPVRHQRRELARMAPRRRASRFAVARAHQLTLALSHSHHHLHTSWRAG